MALTKKAKLFMNGSSQAVRLPAEYRFQGKELFIRRDEITGDVVLSQRPDAHAWLDFFQLMETMDVPEDFLSERPMNVLPAERNLFAEQER